MLLLTSDAGPIMTLIVIVKYMHKQINLKPGFEDKGS